MINIVILETLKPLQEMLCDLISFVFSRLIAPIPYLTHLFSNINDTESFRNAWSLLPNIVNLWKRKYI